VVLFVVYPQEWTGRVEDNRLSSGEEVLEAEETTTEAEVVAMPSQLAADGTKNAEI
jgi:hypothetical protein